MFFASRLLRLRPSIFLSLYCWYDLILIFLFWSDPYLVLWFFSLFLAMMVSRYNTDLVCNKWGKFSSGICNKMPYFNPVNIENPVFIRCILLLDFEFLLVLLVSINSHFAVPTFSTLVELELYLQDLGLFSYSVLLPISKVLCHRINKDYVCFFLSAFSFVVDAVGTACLHKICLL